MFVKESQGVSKYAVSVLEQVETGTFAVPGWMIFPPDSVRVVSWNINRGLHLNRAIEFLSGAKADILPLRTRE